MSCLFLTCSRSPFSAEFAFEYSLGKEKNCFQIVVNSLWQRSDNIEGNSVCYELSYFYLTSKIAKTVMQTSTNQSAAQFLGQGRV